MLCEQHILINIQEVEAVKMCVWGGKESSEGDAQLQGKCYNLFRGPTADALPLKYLSFNYYLLALPLAFLAYSVLFISFLNNVFEWGGFALLRAHTALSFHSSKFNRSSHFSFLNKAHLKNLDANYFALFMPSPSPCRFKHFWGHLDSSNYLSYIQLCHE